MRGEVKVGSFIKRIHNIITSDESNLGKVTKEDLKKLTKKERENFTKQSEFEMQLLKQNGIKPATLMKPIDK